VSYVASVNVMLKEGIADPQGSTIQRALPALGFDGVGDVRVGKHIVLKVDASTPDEARERVEQMCRQLLSNPVIESFEVVVE
jgi:phosphoribosylformylglycinamidine synthase subunit PurS